jgi:NADH:ubiquinone oxidoreductase subunit 5 (subunit L)/multisubunit Na+/H+ antiporter MnhA subunit
MIELGIPSLLLTAVLPVGLAPIAFLYGRVAGHRASELISHTTLGTVLALTALNALRVASGHVIEETYPWLPQLGLSIGLKLDGLSLLFLALISLVGFLASVYSSKYMEGERGLEAYYALLMLFVGGMLGVVLVTNLFLFYVFWELMLIPSYFLIAYWGTGNARVIGFKYFAMTHAGALALLTGIVWLNVLYGNVEFSTLLARAPTDTKP